MLVACCVLQLPEQQGGEPVLLPAVPHGCGQRAQGHEPSSTQPVSVCKIWKSDTWCEVDTVDTLVYVVPMGEHDEFMSLQTCANTFP